MAVYLDSSALVKLVVAEPESGALRTHLASRPDRVCSALARVEVVRAVSPHGRRAVTQANRVLARVQLLRLDDTLLDLAAGLGPEILRSLDAIHLASAMTLEDDLEMIVTYDRRMADAAASLNLPVVAPS